MNSEPTKSPLFPYTLHLHWHSYKKLIIDNMPSIVTCTCNLVFRQVKKWNEYFALLVYKNSCVSGP